MNNGITIITWPDLVTIVSSGLGLFIILGLIWWASQSKKPRKDEDDF